MNQAVQRSVGRVLVWAVAISMMLSIVGIVRDALSAPAQLIGQKATK